jgi:hypothetical protein
MIQEARILSIHDRQTLIKALADTLTDEPFPPKQRSLREFRGLGRHLYDGTDAQKYVNQLRSEWDERP